MLLIFDYWVSGKPLPDDDHQLASITRLSVQKWKVIRPTLAGFFRVGEGAWHHKRIDEELAIATDNIDKRSAAGKMGAIVRWGNRNPTGNGSRITNACDRQCDRNAIANAPSPSPSSSLRSEPLDANASSPSKRGLGERELQREFEGIWPLYPRRVDKGDALKTYRKARKFTSFEDIKAGVERYAAARRGEDPQYTKHFATWLNHQCWADEMPSAATNGAMPDRPDGPPPPLSERELEYLRTGILQ